MCIWVCVCVCLCESFLPERMVGGVVGWESFQAHHHDLWLNPSVII